MVTILVVEDEYFLADDCAASLRSLGVSVAGPVHSLEDGFALLEGIHGAIVDINLGGRAVYPLVDELLRRQIPVVFYTGYSVVDAKYRHIRRFHKPDDCRAATRAVRKLALGRAVGSSTTRTKF
jgi:CheY-like chemotaxis protein